MESKGATETTALAVWRVERRCIDAFLVTPRPTPCRAGNTSA